MTYSIIARDGESGRFGVAVQTCYLAVGSSVPWAEKGVGAVATQARTDISYGYLGMKLIKEGKSAPEVLRGLLTMALESEFRQVSMMDDRGNVATHTGKKCLQAAGSFKGDSFCAQANMVESPDVWKALGKKYLESDQDFPGKLLSALVAAEKEGGDIRGRRSAALLVTGSKKKNYPELPIDLRVDASDRPLDALNDLLRLYRGYYALNRAAGLIEDGDLSGALKNLEKISRYAPGEEYLQFRRAIYLAAEFDRKEEAIDILESLLENSPRWEEIMGREIESGHTGYPDVVGNLLAELR